jgi:plastocyanin domain-containing protein
MTKIALMSLLAAVLLAATAPAAPAAKKKSAPPEQHVAIQVTPKGFEPDTVLAVAGRPLVLEVTRKTDRTCAKEIVIKALGVNQKLPLDRTVLVRVVPKKKGPVRFACGMDMIAGVILVK